MPDRKYPIGGAPGSAWFLVFDRVAGQWLVEEVTTQPRGRRRVELLQFEASAAGRHMAQALKSAIEQASRDAT